MAACACKLGWIDVSPPDVRLGGLKGGAPECELRQLKWNVFDLNLLEDAPAVTFKVYEIYQLRTDQHTARLRPVDEDATQAAALFAFNPMSVQITESAGAQVVAGMQSVIYGEITVSLKPHKHGETSWSVTVTDTSYQPGGPPSLTVSEVIFNPQPCTLNPAPSTLNPP